MAFDASYKDKEELVLRDESVYLEEDVEHANRECLQGEQMERADQNVKEIVMMSRQISQGTRKCKIQNQNELLNRTRDIRILYCKL